MLRGSLAVGCAAMTLAVAGACSDAKTDSAPRPDGGAEDGGGPGSDASGGGGDADTGPSFCSTLSTQPFFCADFDDGASAADVFTSVVGTGATVTDKALRVQAAQEAYVQKDADPNPPWQTIQLGFALTVNALTDDARIVVAEIGQHDTDAPCTVDLEITSKAATLRVTGATATALTKALPTGKSARIVLTLDSTMDAGGLTGNVTVDGQPAIGAPLVSTCTRLPGPPRVSLGRVGGPGTSCDLRFDDVVMDGR